MEKPRAMWPTRLTGQSPERRTAIAASSMALALILIVGGIAFASQASNDDDQAQAVKKASSRSTEQPGGNDNGKPGVGGGTSSTSAPPQQVGTTATTQVATSTTVIGPNGEVLTVPTTVSTTPGGTPTTPGTPTTLITNQPTTPTTQGDSTPTTGGEVPATVPPTTAPRPAAQNGSAQPSANVSVTSSSPEDPHVGLSVSASDSDGYISRIIVDWNDGSPSDTSTYALDGCSDSGNGNPQSDRTVQYGHDYASAGSYNISVTVTSTGCDGASAQDALSGAAVVTGGEIPSAGSGGLFPTIPLPAP